MAKRITLATLKAAAAKFGGTVEDTSSGYHYSLVADTPKGKIWNATDCHCIVADTNDDLAEWRQEARNALLKDIKLGVSDCDDPDCDICNEGD